MTPLAVLALLGFAAFLPIFVNDDDPEAGDDEPEVGNPDTDEPATEEVEENAPPAASIPGSTEGATLIATEDSPNVTGGAGDDTLLSFNDGLEANLDGGEGDDILATNVLAGFPNITNGTQTLTGGAGSDTFDVSIDVTRLSTTGIDSPLVTITDFSSEDAPLNLRVTTFGGSPFQYESVSQQIAEDDSYTDLDLLFTDATGENDDLTATVRVEGIAGLSEGRFTVEDGRVLAEGTDGADTLRSTDFDLGRGGEDTLRGLEGDDLLTQEPVDDAGALVLEGSAGNDTIVASEVEFSNATTLDGGAGDDLLITEPFTSADLETVDTFITGEGADTIAVSSSFPELSSDTDFFMVARVTDFTPGEDTILIDTSPIASGADATFVQEVTLSEDTDGDFTDVRYTVMNSVNNVSLSGTLRLEGLTGLSEADLGFTLGSIEGNWTTSSVVVGTNGDDTIDATV